ncbi:hypothetical protein NliqN6_4072 [Naganishia liquefaciens]|uniref:Uncharacterized protein n=1 Tax=Naganishia liquefaciens TaxID=104408 RepID=A0A8H3YFF4_9TREE|nr:hypothetical protein NliqN6_4072 [Naganishia liquefaciens]
MGLLKLFRSSKSHGGNDQANRANSFSPSVDSNDASLTPPPRIGRESRSVSSSSIRSSSGFLGKKDGRTQSQVAIKTIPYASTPPQAPPPPRSASSSRFSSPRTPVAYNDQMQQASKGSHVESHRLGENSPLTTPLETGKGPASNPRPFSKYVLPDLDLDSRQPPTGALVQFPSNNGRQPPSSRDQHVPQRTRSNSGMSWSNQGEEVLTTEMDRPLERLHSPSSASRTGKPKVEQYQNAMGTPRHRPLPEAPDARRRQPSTFTVSPSASEAHHTQTSASTSSGSATPRPSLSVNPVVLAETSGGNSAGSKRSNSFLSLTEPPSALSKASSNQSVFPWLNRSRSKSPNTLAGMSPNDQGSAPMVKSKSKEKGKWKGKPGEDDGSFKVRAFRHVSSGSGIPPWEVQFEHETPHSPHATDSPRSESDPVIPQRPDLGEGTTSSASADMVAQQRPSLQGLGRPPSVAGSINSEQDSRQVSVQKFKQTRRYSGRSANGIDTFSSEVTDPVFYKSQGHHRIRSDSSGVEVLISPRKKKMADMDSDSTDEEILAPSRQGDNPDMKDRTLAGAMGRSLSTSALEAMPALQSSSARPQKAGTERPPSSPPVVPGIIAHPPRRPPGFAVQGRRAVSVFDQSHQINVESPGLPSSQLSPRPFGHDRSRSTSGIQDLATEISNGSRLTTDITHGRASLHERLAGLAVSIPPTANMPVVSPLECEIPPPPQTPSPEAPKIRASMSRPTSAQAAETQRPIVQQRSTSTLSANRQKARTAWDASSSDEDSDKERKVPRKARTASASKLPPATFKVPNLPSGLRRPPAPSEAFGVEDEETPRRPSLAGSRGSSTGSRASSFNSNRGPQPSSFQKARLSNHSRSLSNAIADDESESSDSSEDEPLTAIKHKHSSASLASGSSLTVPNARSKPSSSTSSPVKSSRSNSNLSLPSAGSVVYARSGSSLFTPPALASTLPTSPVSGRLPLASPGPRPATSFVTAGLRTRDSPASSQSGATTGDTSSGGLPVTPRESSLILGNPVAVQSARSSFSSAQAASNPRRVSFAGQNEHGQASRIAEEELGKKTNERRREEARKATEIGQTANGTLEESHGNAQSPDMYLRQMQAQAAQSGHMQPALSPYFGMSNAPFMDPTQQMYMLQMQMAQMAQMAQMNPGMMQMQQQAIALAKQQYQASMVAAAMQAAEDAWERGSSMTGLGSTTGGNMNPMFQMFSGNNSYPMGMPALFPMHPTYSQAESVYGGNATSPPESRQQNSRPAAAASVYGEAHETRTTPNNIARPNRSRSSPSLDKLMAEQPNGSPSATRQNQSASQRPLPAPSRRPVPQSMVPTKGPDNEIPRTSTHSLNSPSAAAVPPSSWRTRSSVDRIR